MSSSNAKGARREREAINRLKGEGWFPMKAPASGSATDRELPDLIAGTSGVSIAAEVKTADPDNGNVYVDAEKVDDLYLFAKAFGMVPVFLARWDGDTTWYWAEPSDVSVTESGNYRLDPTVSARDWRTVDAMREVLKRAEDF